MATAAIEEYVSETDWGHILFSKQYCGQLIKKVVKIDSVVQKVIDSMTISEAERKSLRNQNVADQKLRHLLTIITDHSNRDDLQPFKTFIDILEESNNVNVTQHLLLIYFERVNSLETRRRLLEEKEKVENLKDEISRLQRILDETETVRENKMSLELTRIINDLEATVEHKSNVICKGEKEIEEKEQEVRKAIEESNHLRLKIDTLQQQHSKSMKEDKKMSKKIEILEDELSEKENAIIDLRKNKTMTQEEIEKELGNIMKGQEKKLDDQTTMIKQQNETIDVLRKGQTAMMQQQKETIDDLIKDKTEMIKQQKDQMTAVKEQNKAIDKLSTSFMMVLKVLEKK